MSPRQRRGLRLIDRRDMVPLGQRLSLDAWRWTVR
jgi:hypothetical protein